MESLLQQQGVSDIHLCGSHVIISVVWDGNVIQLMGKLAVDILCGGRVVGVVVGESGNIAGTVAIITVVVASIGSVNCIRVAVEDIVVIEEMYGVGVIVLVEVIILEAAMKIGEEIVGIENAVRVIERRISVVAGHGNRIRILAILVH